MNRRETVLLTSFISFLILFFPCYFLNMKFLMVSNYQKCSLLLYQLLCQYRIHISKNPLLYILCLKVWNILKQLALKRMHIQHIPNILNFFLIMFLTERHKKKRLITSEKQKANSSSTSKDTYLHWKNI